MKHRLFNGKSKTQLVKDAINHHGEEATEGQVNAYLKKHGCNAPVQMPQLYTLRKEYRDDDCAWRDQPKGMPVNNGKAAALVPPEPEPQAKRVLTPWYVETMRDLATFCREKKVVPAELQDMINDLRQFQLAD